PRLLGARARLALSLASMLANTLACILDALRAQRLGGRGLWVSGRPSQQLFGLCALPVGLPHQAACLFGEARLLLGGARLPSPAGGASEHVGFLLAAQFCSLPRLMGRLCRGAPLRGPAQGLRLLARDLPLRRLRLLGLALG